MPWKETLGCFGFGMHLVPSFSDLFQIYCMNLSSWVWWRLLVPSWALPPDRAALNLASAACMGLGMFGGPQNRDHFDLADAIGPLWDLLLAVGKILLLGKAALYGDGAGQPWVFGGFSPQHGEISGPSCLDRLSCQINMLINLVNAANMFLQASRNTGRIIDKHIRLKTKVSTWAKAIWKG